MAILDKLIARAGEAGKKLVLPEGQDPRVVKAAEKIVTLGIAKKVTVLGTEDEIAKACKEAGVAERLFETLDPATSPKLDEYAQILFDERTKKGKEITIEKAKSMMQNRLFYGNMMTKVGEVDGLVAGSIASTGDMLRSAFTVVGTAKGIKTGSSCMVMDLSTPTPAGDSTVIFADCGVNPDPDAEMLVDIAIATAQTYKALMNKTPRVAFLSFSTCGSACHPTLEKITKARSLMEKRVADLDMDVIFDGELQADAAIVPQVASQKCPESPVEGKANVLIFPDLNSGNICYKMIQRLAGASAYGPILQGLAKPINDLSRGCFADDIVGVAAITVCQSIG